MFLQSLIEAEEGMLSYETLDAIADSVNPTLGVVSLLVPWVKRNRSWRQALLLNAITFVAVALAYVLQALDNATGVWPSAGLDFSTHTAIFIAVASSLWQHGIAWRWGVLAVGAGYAILMRIQNYHSWLDMITTSIAIVPLLVLIWWAVGRLPWSNARAYSNG